MHKILVSRRIVLAACLSGLALLAGGCSPATQVVGTWDIDPNKPMPSEFVEANPLIGAMLLLGKPQFEITFAGDGSFAVKASIGPAKQDWKGSWRFVKSEGKTLLLMIKRAGETEEDELRFTLVDNEHAEIQVPVDVPGRKRIKPAFPFVRKKESTAS